MQENPDSGEGSGPVSPEFAIRFTKGKEVGKTIPLEGDRITIGRRSGNRIVIPDIKISGVHAEIVFEGGRPVIRDLGSTNGTLLEGRKIDEMVLSEGDRITIGEAEFVLVKSGEATEIPEAGDTEGTAEGDAEDEVRVVRDVRGIRRGAGGIILLVLMLLGLCGAAYYYFFYSRPGKVGVGVPAAKGNLLAEGWSFEASAGGGDISEVWSVKAASETAFSRSRKDRRSGFYAANVSMPEKGWARILYKKPVKLRLRRQYTASAWVKITGQAMVALKAVFFDGTGGSAETAAYLYTDAFVSARDEGMGYSRIEGTVMPPPEAKTLHFEIVVAGEGEAVLDDVELFEQSAAQPDLLGSSEAMDFFSCGPGFLVRRIDHTLFSGGRLVVLFRSGEDEVERFDSDTAGFSTPDGEYLFCGPGLGLRPMNRGLEVNAEKIEGTFSLPAVVSSSFIEVRYCFDLMNDYASNGIGIIAEDEYSLYESSFPPVRAKSLLLGGAHDRVKISFERPVQVLGEEGRDGGVSVQCLFKEAPAEFKFRIQTGFKEELRQVQSLVQQASRALQEGRYGEALKLIDQVVKRFPYHESAVNRAEQIKTTILEKKRDWLAGFRERLKTARFLNTPELFSALEATCKERLERFPGDKDFEAALKEVLEQGSALKHEIQNIRAERYYLIVQNLRRAGGRESTLSEVLRYMQERFPDSEWTIKAVTPESGDGPENSEESTEDAGQG